MFCHEVENLFYAQEIPIELCLRLKDILELTLDGEVLGFGQKESRILLTARAASLAT